MFKAFLITGISLIVGFSLGTYSHPYESCDRLFDIPNEITECVQLLKKSK